VTVASQPNACIECGKGLGRDNRTGLCHAHSAARIGRDPSARAKVSATRRRLFQADPAFRQRAADQLVEARKHRGNPGENFKRDRLWEKGNAVRPAGSPARLAAGAQVSATKLAWCPPHLRGEYRFLTQRKRLFAGEARAIIEAQHETDMQRWRRSVGAVTEPPDARLVFKAESDDALLTAIAEEFGFTLTELRAEGWYEGIAQARRTCVHILKAQGRSYPVIARLLGRTDHTTAIAAHRRYERKATPQMRDVAAMFLGQPA
jgi:hypothetical protein